MISPTTVVESPKTLYSFGREIDYDEQKPSSLWSNSANGFSASKVNDNQVFHDNLTANDNSTDGKQVQIDCVILDKLYDSSSHEYVSLRMPIVFRIENDENGFYYINKEYNLFVYGETPDEARENILEDLRGLCCLYLDEDDANLDDNALKLKKRLSKLI